ncbi:MAG: CusA/CzcA family heavy metal efflux RND transporter, partial [Nitrospirota bacterium]|nr:CusA/CzcA family heavy metal efflux RND transporter [Nitrospirota bacterium]
MIDKLITFALRQRLLILIAVALLVGFGIYSYTKLPIDAFPDVTGNQVQVITKATGRSPVEVEKLVTYPVEMQMQGLPRMVELRSLSKFGLSVVTVVFEDGVDIYFARQLVMERLMEARERLPEGVEPTMGPISTGLGEIYQYTLERGDDGTGGSRTAPTTNDLMDLRAIQDWIVRPILKTVPGVTDVNSFGGYVKQYQIQVEPAALAKYNLTLHEIFERVAASNANAGGNVIEHGAEQYVVRGLGLIGSMEEIGDIVVKEHEGSPVFVRDVARVTPAPETRQGSVVKDGKGESVAGIVLMVMGGSGKEVVAGVKAKVQEINSSGVLPDGAKIIPFYDRSELVEKCIGTVTTALAEGAILVIIVLYLFLRNLRGALVVAVTLPLAVLATFIIMREVGLTANLMSLGGLAISLGMIVDAAIIQVENVQRHLSDSAAGKAKILTVLEAVLEVRKPSLFGELIIALTFLPLLTLEGMEGKMFIPLALTVIMALFASLLLSVFVIPVLASFFMKAGKEKESILVTWARQAYHPVLAWTMRHRKAVLSGAAALFAGTLSLVPFLGTEFIPTLDEGSLTTQIIRLPNISMTESVEIEKKTQQVLMKFPEVVTVVSKIGAAEIATDPMGPNISDPIVILKPKDQWKTARTKEELVEKIREELEKVPGIGINVTQPIALRVDELISGVKSQIAVKLFGEDMDILHEKAAEIAKALSPVKGVTDLRVEQVAGQTYLEVDIDRRRIARYGINVADVQEVIETAVGGKTATEVFEGDRRFAVAVRFPEEYRNSVEAIGRITVKGSGGARIPLASLADIRLTEGPVQVSRENTRRRVVIECNVEGRDIGGFVAEAQQRLGAQVKLPAGYYVTWGGAFENQQRAMKRLAVIVPLTVALIFFLLFSTFNSLRH